MEKVAPVGRQVILDRCPQGEGIWFDAGELARALAGPEAAGGRPGFSGEARNAMVRAVENFLGAALAEG
jgi:Zn-finger nucleic acid-binding protein